MAEYAVVEVHSSSARDAESQTIEVLASPVDRKLTNDLLKLLSQELPMADVGLEHLKRVRRTSATAEQGDAGAGRLVLTVLLSTRERFRAVSPERLGRFALQPSPVVVPRFAARTPARAAPEAGEGGARCGSGVPRAGVAGRHVGGKGGDY